MSMRRPTLLVVMLCVVGVGAATAPAKTDRADVRGVCQTNGIDIFFWPQGHPAIPALGFPAFGAPHVEFYRPRDVSNAAAIAYLDATQRGISANHCSPVTDTPMTFASDATPQTTNSTQKIRCTFSGNVDMRMAAWTRVTRRVVTRTIRVRGKTKKVRRTIRRTVTVGNLATIGSSGSPGALVDVRVSAVAGTSSSLKFDTRSCVPVDVTG
jgi:hypothetical protein